MNEAIPATTDATSDAIAYTRSQLERRSPEPQGSKDQNHLANRGCDAWTAASLLRSSGYNNAQMLDTP